MNTVYILIIAFFAILVGSALTFISLDILKQQKLLELTGESLDILNKATAEANKIRDEKIVEAQIKCEEIKLELEKEINIKVQNLKAKEEIILEKEQKAEKGIESIARKQAIIDQVKEDVDNLRQEKIQSLEKIAGISAEDAKKQIFIELENEVRFNASLKLRKIIDESNANAAKEAKKIILSTIQRTAAEQTIENTSNIIVLEDNTQKGIIIGKDGRNIKSLEMVTGVDIIIDETPNSIVVSSFDPVRREIARISIQNLLQDGRVHPGRIEEVVSKVEANIEKEILNIGQHTILDLGIYGIHEEIIKLIGRMKYRTSYGQNLLHHSREVANLAATMAAEVGLDVQKAKRAGLLHDIGKVSNANPDLTHAILGMQIAEQYGEHYDVCNAIGAHHDEIEMTAMISPIVQACDAISGARPGARRDVVQQYSKRLHDMEDIAISYQGVKNCYAIQAGRELRVMVDADQVTDDRAAEITFDIARQIEREVQYPGQIKVIVVREKRIIDFAK